MSAAASTFEMPAAVELGERVERVKHGGRVGGVAGVEVLGPGGEEVGAGAVGRGRSVIGLTSLHPTMVNGVPCENVSLVVQFTFSVEPTWFAPLTVTSDGVAHESAVVR